MLSVEILLHFSVDPVNGTLYLLKDNKPIRRLIPNEDNLQIVSVNGVRIKMKHDRLVWCAYHKELISKDDVVFHKDLDENNCAISNLQIISKKVNFQIAEALKNISSAKIVSHPYDAFSYILEYKKDGRTKKEVVSDVTVAKRKLLKLKIECSRFVGKYIHTS